MVAARRINPTPPTPRSTGSSPCAGRRPPTSVAATGPNSRPTRCATGAGTAIANEDVRRVIEDAGLEAGAVNVANVAVLDGPFLSPRIHF